MFCTFDSFFLKRVPQFIQVSTSKPHGSTPAHTLGAITCCYSENSPRCPPQSPLWWLELQMTFPPLSFWASHRAGLSTARVLESLPRDCVFPHTLSGLMEENDLDSGPKVCKELGERKDPENGALRISLKLQGHPFGSSWIGLYRQSCFH